MSYVDSTANSSNSVVAKSVAVPTGVQADDIIILVITTDATANFDSGHYPTGFVELAEIDNTLDGQTSAVAWKRATGADTGTYDFISSPGGSNWVCVAAAFRGRHTTNAPEISSSANNTGNTNPVTVTATTVTAVTGDDLVWISCPDVNTSGAGNGHTQPTGYSKQEDEENAFSNICLATKESVSAGATGSISGTFAITGGTSGYAAYLVRIPAAAAGGGGTNQNKLIGKFGGKLVGKAA